MERDEEVTDLNLARSIERKVTGISVVKIIDTHLRPKYRIIGRRAYCTYCNTKRILYVDLKITASNIGFLPTI